MASINKQGKNNKTSYKIVLKWEKEFNKTYICNLEGRMLLDFVGHFVQNGKDLFVPSKTLAITIFAQFLPHLKKTV